MIRSVELSLKFANKDKRSNLRLFLAEYRRVVKLFIDMLWDTEYSKFLHKDIVIDSWLSARAKQCAGKQALVIIHGTLKKYKQRCYMYDKLAKSGQSNAHIKCVKPAKPVVGNIPAELDSRFCEIQTGDNTFDLWIKLSSLGNKIKELIPLRKTKIFNKWNGRGVIKQSIRLTDSSIIVFFDLMPSVNFGHEVVVIDIGLKSCLSLSNGVQIKTCPHGHSLDSISKMLSRRKKGGNGFKQTQRHRQNFINWSVNQLKQFNLKQIAIEGIKHLRKGKRTSRLLSHFTYADIMRKLELFCEEWNVSIVKVNPAYTSQSCSKCGHVETKNRKLERFKCKQCGFTDNADLNASRNILASL